MPQEELGYIELEWTCENCGSRNPGTRKNCATCGAAMSARNQFELPAQQERLTDQDKVARAAVGPDIACPYCGTRNLGNATACKQCGGDLKGARAQSSGGVLGAFDDAPQAEIKCATCGALNSARAAKCQSCSAPLPRLKTQAAAPTSAPAPAQTIPRAWLIGGVIVALLLCAGAMFLLFRSSDARATVDRVTWQRTIAIMAQMPVRDATWQDQLPSDAKVLGCELKDRRYSNSPEPNSKKICGTPYVIDQGNGMGQVAQDCQYLVRDQYCSFTRLQWSVVDTVTARGADLNPVWPALALQNEQKEGNRAEEYRVEFVSGKDRYTYNPSSAQEFARFLPGSQWGLKVNAFGSVMDATSAE